MNSSDRNKLKKGKVVKIIKKGIIKERIKAKDLTQLNFKYACEDCSYFIPEKNLCSLGYNTEPHLKVNQDRQHQLTGKLILCRFLEID